MIGFRHVLVGQSMIMIIEPSSAYSLRNLYEYTGSVIRGRRVNTPAEQDFTALGIIDGTLAAWSLGGDVFVPIIYDQNSTFDEVQSDPTKQPKIVNAGTVITSNGKPAILSDGVDDFMQSPTGILPNDINGYMNLTVSKHVSGATHMGISNGGYTSSNNWQLIRVISSIFRGDINFNPTYNDFGASSRNISLQYNPSDLLQHLHVYRFCGGDKVCYQIDNLVEVLDDFEISVAQNFNKELDFFAFDNLGVATAHGSIYWQETQLFDKYIDDVSYYKSDINNHYSIY